ncbi:hypothetical protein IJM86_06130 [bacterium]|nr:hypothetical protein [bacterium]
MGQSLLPYIDIKIHHCLDELNFQQIHILPLYDHDFTNTIISKKEKTGKKFNRKRPTGEIEDNIFLLKCFP